MKVAIFAILFGESIQNIQEAKKRRPLISRHLGFDELRGGTRDPLTFPPIQILYLIIRYIDNLAL